MEITTGQEESIRQAAEDFRKAMGIRSSMNLRVAKRVTFILRISMVSFGLVSLMLLIMLYAFTSKMDEMILALDTMNGQFSSMSKDMTTMRTTLYRMENNISYVSAITQVTRDISGTVGAMKIEVDGMKGIIASLNYEVYGITDQVNNMTGQMRLLDPAVQYIGRDVNRMSGPMRLFNDFNPFD
ncbi:MAG: hypothetical protein IZT55_00005 [Anaerolineae bacterium]|nr:hypothetical protein [Anaerolineae bacterium]